ncbi:MAG: ComF family protein [Acutalibacteraceae bacterium]
MNQDVSELLRGIRYIFFPRRCAFCGKVIAPQTLYCADCSKHLPRICPPICYHCGRSLADCQCKKHRNRFVSAFAAPFYYEGAVRESIHRLKFHHETDNGEVLGAEMGAFAKEVFPEVHIDFVTHVPMTAREYRERGFNQSELLAKSAAQTLRLPHKAVLEKIYETERQRTLSQRRRSGNVLGVFALTDETQVRGKRILLCDDLCTTGATLSECAKMLMIYGAREVLCLTAAVGFPKPGEKG